MASACGCGCSRVPRQSHATSGTRHRSRWQGRCGSRGLMKSLLPFALAVAALALQTPSTALTDYEGVYAYHGGSKLVIVAADPLLVAVIDDAKYPLRQLGADTFKNASGDTIPFRRSADGSVSGFVE